MAQSEQPIRVLYLARAPFVSGAERALLSQLRHLDRQQVQPGLVLGQESDLHAAAAKLRIPVWVMPMPKRGARAALAWWKSLRQLRRIIAEFKPGILHANDVPSCQAMSVVGAEKKIPRVMHVRWTITAADAGWWARSGVEHVLCISQWVREQLGDTVASGPGVPLASAKVTVLPDAVDWPAEKSPGGAEGSQLAFIPPPRKDPVIGFAGQLIPEKGLELLIRALGQMPAGSRPRLLIAGRDTQRQGIYQAELATLARNQGVADRIEWLGFLDDVGSLYGRVSAMVCPSVEEPLGLIPLEAAEFHVPTIANKTGELMETIVNGKTGWLVEPTPAAWARALEQLSDRAAVGKLGQAAHQRTRMLYAPAGYQRKLMEVYRALAPTRGPGHVNSLTC